MKSATERILNRLRRRNRQRSWFELAMLLPAFALLGGCASAKFVATGERYTAKPEDCLIQVFSSQEPGRPYVELGILEGKGGLGSQSLANILPKMKEEACLVGGDAIILMDSQRSSHVTGSLDEGHVASREELNVTATVIRWIDEN